MIQDILTAIQTTLQAESRLASITDYHLVDGMVPGVKPSVSICCGKLKYSDYDRDQDDVIASVRIYVYLKDMKVERGEASIRSLTHEVRFTLLEHMYLGGLVDVSTVTDIAFESDQVQNGELLHYAMIDFEVKYYESRQRPADLPPPTVAEIDAAFNSESINIQL